MTFKHRCMLQNCNSLQSTAALKSPLKIPGNSQKGKDDLQFR